MTEYKRFENTPGWFRSARIVEKQTHNGNGYFKDRKFLVEINNEAEPFSDMNIKMLFTVDSLREIAGWAEREIKKAESKK